MIMNERLDIAIIGTGPAGLSAAVNAKVRNKSFKIFGSEAISTKVEKAHEINNDLGFYGKSGAEVRDNFLEHINQMGIKVTEDKVSSIYPMGDYYALIGGKDQYEAKTVILACGVNFGKMLPGEAELLGRGVSYCATCDAALYRDKTVVIIAYNKHEEAEADFMAEVAGKVFYIPMYKETVEVASNIEVIRDTPKEVVGDIRVQKLVTNNREIVTDGVFILRDSISPAQLLPSLEIDNNHIKVDRTMTTNLPGCFACGDIVGTPYQYIKAAGEGNIASLSAVSYIEQMKRQAKNNI